MLLGAAVMKGTTQTQTHAISRIQPFAATACTDAGSANSAVLMDRQSPSLPIQPPCRINFISNDHASAERVLKAHATARYLLATISHVSAFQSQQLPF
eukprot:4615135-Amphidinium_carterae.1